MRYDFVTGQTIWNLHFDHGVDMPCYQDGKVYYGAGSGNAKSKTWYIIDADTGADLGTLTGGPRPHNDICHNGIVYMGGESSTYLAATGRPHEFCRRIDRDSRRIDAPARRRVFRHRDPLLIEAATGGR